MKTSDLAKICELEDNRVILYGYTFDRNTVYVFVENGKLIRVVEDYAGQPVSSSWHDEVDPKVFYRDIKRWYKGATNPRFRDLYNSLSSDALIETGGGEHMFNKEIYFDLTQ